MSLELLNLTVFPVQIAHSHIAVKFSENKFPLRSFPFKKAIGNFLTSSQPHCCKDIITNLLRFCQAFY